MAFATATGLTNPSLPRKLLSALGLAFIVTIAAYFNILAASRYVHFDSKHYRLFWPARWWLLIHLGSGTCALLLGPVQFIPAIRRRYVTFHRWTGRTYLLGVLVGTLTAVYMSLYVDPSPAGGLSLLFLAVAWLTTSSMAFIAALRRQFSVHREWMIRSYVVTFAFVVYRFLTNAPVIASFSPEASAVTRGWLCWSVPLLLTEVALGWERMLRERRTNHS